MWKSEFSSSHLVRNGIGVTLIVSGIILILMKKMTTGIRSMIAITEKIREGNFAFRLGRHLALWEMAGLKLKLDEREYISSSPRPRVARG